MSLLIKGKLDSNLEKELLDRQHSLREDYKWIAKSRKLRTKYYGKFVLVKDKEVVYSEKSVYTLIRKLNKEGKNISDFAVHYVRERPACLLL